MENKPKKAKTKKKRVLCGSVLSSWYRCARPDPVGLRCQQLLRNLHSERDRSETLCSQTPSRTRHPPGILLPPAQIPPPRPGWSLVLPPTQFWGQESCRGIYPNCSQRSPRMEARNTRATGHVWAGHCDARRGGGDGSNAPVNHYSSVTLQTFFFS